MRRRERKTRELADHTTEQFQREHEVRELRKKRRRDFFRRLLRRS